jgi:hypothetical protein
MTSETRLRDLESEARYHRERLRLYRAKMYGGRPTSPVRLRELEHSSEFADERARRARAEITA